MLEFDFVFPASSYTTKRLKRVSKQTNVKTIRNGVKKSAYDYIDKNPYESQSEATNIVYVGTDKIDHSVVKIPSECS